MNPLLFIANLLGKRIVFSFETKNNSDFSPCSKGKRSTRIN